MALRKTSENRIRTEVLIESESERRVVFRMIEQNIGGKSYSGKASWTPTKAPPACSTMTARSVLIASVGLSGEIEYVIVAMERPILILT